MNTELYSIQDVRDELLWQGYDMSCEEIMNWLRERELLVAQNGSCSNKPSAVAVSCKWLVMDKQNYDDGAGTSVHVRRLLITRRGRACILPHLEHYCRVGRKEVRS